MKFVETLTPKLRKHWQWWVYPLSFLFFALVSFALSLPRDRIKEHLERELSAETSASPIGLGMDVQIENLSTSLFTGLGATAHHMVLRTRPSNPQEKVARYVIDKLQVRVGMWGLLWDRPTVRVSAIVDNGTVTVGYNQGFRESLVDAQVKDFALESLPALQAVIGLPTTGVLTVKSALTVPNRPPPPKGLPGAMLRNQSTGDVSKTNGKIEIALDNWTIGDGKAQFSPTGDMNMGITMPSLRLGKMSGKIIVDKGHAEFEKFFSESPDGEAVLDGNIELRDPVLSSSLHLYVRFKPSDALIKREEKMQSLTLMLDMAKRSDGYYGIQVTGSLGAPIFLASKTEPLGVRLPSASTSPSAPAFAPPPRPIVPMMPTVHISPPGGLVPSPPPIADDSRDRDREREAPPPPPPREATPPTVEVPHAEMPAHVAGALRGEAAIVDKKEEGDETNKEPKEPVKEKEPASETP